MAKKFICRMSKEFSMVVEAETEHEARMIADKTEAEDWDNVEWTGVEINEEEPEQDPRVLADLAHSRAVADQHADGIEAYRSLDARTEAQR